MHADAGASRSNSMAPLAKGTPCCTTVALGAEAGAKALPPRAISARRTFCILQFAVLQADLLCSVGEHEAISTSFFLGCEGAVDVLLQFRTLFDRQKTSRGTKQIGVGFFTAQKNQPWRLAFVDFAHLGGRVTIAIAATFARAAD